MSIADNEAVVRRAFAAYNDRAWSRVSELALPSVELAIEPNNEQYRGSAGLMNFCREWVQAFADSHLTVTSLVADDWTVAVQFDFRGTHTGTLKSALGDVVSTGRTVHDSSAAFFSMEEGKIRRVYLHIDLLRLLRQLNVQATLKSDTDAGTA